MEYLLLSVVTLFNNVWSCGYDSCTQPEKGVLNVHIVPHTHNDVGWVKTIDQYYEDQVEQILDSVVQELWQDPKRRFMYVETAFLWRWWGNQDEKVKKQVRILVKDGRLKFVGGAWTMNDEATTHYQSIIDQHTWGLRKLNDMFGECATPKVGWQIDSFGHSREFASLLAAMGYDGLFLCRIDSEEYKRRLENKALEFIWSSDDDKGSSSNIFTGILYNNRYSLPEELNFGAPNLFSRDNSTSIKTFYKLIKRQNEIYKTNNILITVGEDFAYKEANIWFENIDMLIKYFNKKSKEDNLNISLFYSTPDCYLKAVKNAIPDISLKRDDFFPYFSQEGYWTGYYTSRPSLKYFERDANRYLQMMKQLYVLAGLDQDEENVIIDELRTAMGVMQHHDAITGTAKQYVTEDYKQTLNKAVVNSLIVPDKAFAKLAESNYGIFKFVKCALNQSECVTSETSQNFIVIVYNPLAWEIFEVDVIIPVELAKYVVHDSYGNEINSTLVPILNWHQKNIPSRRSKATHELRLKAKSLKALGFQSFYFQKLKKSTGAEINVQSNQFEVEEDLLEYGSSIISAIESGYYPSALNSGAYLFAPDALEPVLRYSFTFRNYNTTNDIKRNVIAILKQMKKKRNCVVLQITWLCNTISVEDDVGKEVIVRYYTNIENDGKFYTDSNGRQMIKRRLLNRNIYIHERSENLVAGNYYPVPSKILLKDNKTRFTVITDRSEGGYSPKDGTIELMVNRRLVSDDNLGVEEALSDTESVNIINHYLIISNAMNKESIIDEKRLHFEINMAPIILFSDASHLSLNKWLNMHLSNSGLKRDLPEGIHLLTLEPWRKWQLLIRIENYLERSDSKSTTIKVDICDIFTTVTLKSMRETTLAANQWLGGTLKNCSEIKLYSRQIRTFIFDYEVKSLFERLYF